MKIRSLVQSNSFIKKFLPEKDTVATVLDNLSMLPWLVDYCSDKIVGTYVISFPKCGVTWLRLMMGKAIELHFNLDIADINLIGQLDNTITSLNPNIPRIRVKHDDEPHKKAPEQLQNSKVGFRYSKVIFLVRDPRDIVTSLYFYGQTRPDFKKINSSDISSFIRSKIGSFDTILSYFNIWAENQSIPKQFLVVRYEDLHLNPQAELRKVLDLLSLNNVSDAVIQKAIEFTQFENMRKLEKKNAFKTLMKGYSESDTSTLHTRKGKVGSYQEDLSQEDINFLNNRMDKILSPKSKLLYRYYSL
jgi:Sulfotransferase domain